MLSALNEVHNGRRDAPFLPQWRLSPSSEVDMCVGMGKTGIPWVGPMGFPREWKYDQP